MKRILMILAFAFSFTFAFAFFTDTANANSTIRVTIDGEAVLFQGQQPVISDGRTLVPIRGVFETLGFDVGWNQNARQATLTRGSDTIIITIDSATFTHNGISHALDVPAQIINGSTLLPIRAVLERVDYEVDWIGGEVVIFSPRVVIPAIPNRRLTQAELDAW
ncbi:MAG: copper amine oxidase N-terminal domain-containing protein, partial [Defluviitaleaceae bacterium]|nr:copper amine oxidase N-terminal domain-containing protein [Defluviitaleaceae bacterium]